MTNDTCDKIIDVAMFMHMAGEPADAGWRCRRHWSTCTGWPVGGARGVPVACSAGVGRPARVRGPPTPADNPDAASSGGGKGAARALIDGCRFA